MVVEGFCSQLRFLFHVRTILSHTLEVRGAQIQQRECQLLNVSFLFVNIK